jgi:hypothetical protein
MAKKKTQLIKAKTGRNTKYKPEYAERAKGLCLLGYTNIMLAASFGVTESTIYEWQIKHPEFSEALKAGREVADTAVANALHEKAKAGDTTAMIFWLKNRQRLTWRDKHDIEQSGSVEIKHKIDLSALSPAELTALEALVSKAAK